MELGEHLNQEDFVLALSTDPKKPKGQLELGLTYTPPLKEAPEEKIGDRDEAESSPEVRGSLRAALR